MGISIVVSQNLERQIYQILTDIVRRAIDGTVVPIFVDYSNQRVIIGGISSLGAGSKFQVQGSDVEVTTAGKGFVLQNRAGTQRYRLIMENDGTISADPIA